MTYTNTDHQECGLLVMSDIVSLQYREDNHMNDGVFFEGPTFGKYISSIQRK